VVTIPPATGPAPSRVRLRMYRVGFGDCFLLSFEYPAPLADGRSVRHILIDFGSMSLARGQTSLLAVARLIGAHTKSELDVMVVSHRHRDHLSAFGSADIAALLAKPGYPKLVVRSWTEDPAATPRATGARALATERRSTAIADRSVRFLSTLGRAERFSEVLERKTDRATGRSLAAGLHRLAFGQLKNPAAVAQLQKWAKKGSATYLHYGLPSGIEAIIPGVTVHVLGPPTVDQHPAVATQRSRDPDEFWMLYQGLARGLSPDEFDEDPAGDEPFGAAGDPSSDQSSTVAPDASSLEAPTSAGRIGDPGPVRWLTDQMSRQQLNSLMRIVRILDDVLNNTSVILLFEVPGVRPLKLLFPGDAQIENWEYALKVVPERKANLDLLRKVDLYKVGHHGSRNATPRTLFNLWNEPATATHPMTAVMSTKANVHGDSPATAVPRKTLVAALDTRMQHLYSTQKLTSAESFYELQADLTTNAGLVKVSGP
jgi:beta-lactamase superfamily II metal-dependent hydrolase